MAKKLDHGVPSWAWALLVGIVSILAIFVAALFIADARFFRGGGSDSSFPVTSTLRPVQPVEVSLDPTNWSETILLPSEKLRFSGARFLGARVRNEDSENWTEWTREEFLQNSAKHLTQKQFPGQIQLRGNGRARISVRE